MMSERQNLKYIEFFEEPCKYSAFIREDSPVDISYVIVDDEPGPYIQYIYDIVESGRVYLAITAPFSDKTLRLLRGEEISFSQEYGSVSLRIRNLTQCLLLLDMRNDSSQSFEGYNRGKNEIAGYQFRRRLKRFPGKTSFVTRYGRGMLEKMGISGAYGIVPLSIKTPYRGPMGNQDVQKLYEVFHHLEFELNSISGNLIQDKGSTVLIIFNGQKFPIKNSKSVQAFKVLVTNKGKEMSNKDLCELIGYRPRGGTIFKDKSKESVIQDGLTISSGSSDCFEKISRHERKKFKEKYAFTKVKIKEIRNKIDLLNNKINVENDSLGRLKSEFYKKISEEFGNDLNISRFNSVDLGTISSELCNEDQEYYNKIYARYLSETKKIYEKKKRIELRLKKCEAMLRETQKSNREAYLFGFKGKLQGDLWKIPSDRRDKITDYVRKLIPRLINQLEIINDPSPSILIKHITDNIVQSGRTIKCAGRDTWTID